MKHIAFSFILTAQLLCSCGSNGRSNESRQARLDGRVVTDEGEAKEIQGRQVELTISNPSDKVAYMLRIVLKDKKGRIIDGVTFSDNYISIEPNGEKTVTCLLPGEMKFKVDVLPY